MVRQGAFTVQLVDATTKEPFWEHEKSDGTHYVEVEPNVEYWVRVINHLPNQRCMSSITVDGRGLGLTKHLWGKHASSDCGIWSRTNQVSTTKALRVKLLGASKGRDPFFIGTVMVKFHEAITDDSFSWSQCKDVKSKWSETEVTSSSVDGKKAVVSSTGTTTVSSTDVPSRSRNYTRGKLLETITLKYCTCAGLIHDGVLFLPRTRNRRYSVISTNAPASLRMDPDQVNSQPTNANVLIGHNSMLFDLTGQDDDDDFDDDDDDDDHSDDNDSDYYDSDAGYDAKQKKSSKVSTKNPGKLHVTLERPENVGSSTVSADRTPMLYDFTGDLDDDDASSGADSRARSKRMKKSESSNGLVEQNSLLCDLPGCEDGVTDGGADTTPRITEDLESGNSLVKVEGVESDNNGAGLDLDTAAVPVVVTSIGSNPMESTTSVADSTMPMVSPALQRSPVYVKEEQQGEDNNLAHFTKRAGPDDIKDDGNWWGYDNGRYEKHCVIDY